MTIVEAYNYFLNGIVDKFGDPSIEASEFTDLFNTCQLAELKDDFKPSEEPTKFENTDVVLMKWKTLIKQISVPNAAQVTWADLETAAGGDIFKLNYVSKDGNYARYVRHNDLGATMKNGYKAPTESYPIWLGYDSYITVLPNTGTLALTVTKYPTKVNLDETNPLLNVDPDLTDAAINSILLRMAEHFGAKIREQSLFVNAGDLQKDE